MLQLCCQADTELLNTTELQDKVKQAVRSVPVEECIPLTKQLLQYITLSVGVTLGSSSEGTGEIPLNPR